jgi:hypothetical protein
VKINLKKELKSAVKSSENKTLAIDVMNELGCEEGGWEKLAECWMLALIFGLSDSNWLSMWLFECTPAQESPPNLLRSL